MLLRGRERKGGGKRGRRGDRGGRQRGIDGEGGEEGVWVGGDGEGRKRAFDYLENSWEQSGMFLLQTEIYKK